MKIGCANCLEPSIQLLLFREKRQSRLDEGRQFASSQIGFSLRSCDHADLGCSPHELGLRYLLRHRDRPAIGIMGGDQLIKSQVLLLSQSLSTKNITGKCPGNSFVQTSIMQFIAKMLTEILFHIQISTLPV